MGAVGADESVLTWTRGDETLRVEPWGENSVRVRVAPGAIDANEIGALGERPPLPAPVAVDRGRSRLEVGTLRVEIGPDARLHFSRSADGGEVLSEERAHFWWPGARTFRRRDDGWYRVEQRFRAYAGERIFGLGQHQHGLLDQKGAVIDLVQRNGEVSIPFLVSNRGYGFLWNTPAVGRVELGATGTRWVAEASRQIDYWITAGRPDEIAATFAGVTGHAPVLPEWAAGLWQSKLRYRTQEELLEVAREYRRRGLPLSVIVCDFFHWPQLGDWRFEESEWPDPAAMVRELEELGVRLMVSVWPSATAMSSNWDALENGGLLVGTAHGPPTHAEWSDRGAGGPIPAAFYDSTNPAARRFLWGELERNYYDHGVRVFWLDACEPEIGPGNPENLVFAAGPGEAVVNRYPLDHARMVHEGMAALGETEIVSLCRSAWAGSQRFGAAVWSGDIPATFDSLARQVRAGLNIGLSGIPWWTSDIGGFHGGSAGDPAYSELMIRWFQYGTFCPVHRLHGHRLPHTGTGPDMTGGPNELWSFGDDAERVMSRFLAVREALRPYLLEQMRAAAERGLPPMRPLWFDAPEDPIAWTIEDEFVLGPDVLVAPITELGVRSRVVYLPAGTPWRDAVSGQLVDGGSWCQAPAPIDWIPVFLRADSQLELSKLLASDG